MPHCHPMRTLCGAALALSGLALATPAHAQATGDRLWLEVSAFWPDVDTKISVSTPNGAVGTEIDLESDLDLADRKGLASVFAGVRLGGRWSLIGEYYALDRSASNSIARDIVFDGVTYPLGVTIQSGFDTNVYRAAIGYSFVQSERAEAGVALGLHMTDFVVSLSGQGRIGAAALQTQTRRRDALAPLPTLGLYGGVQAWPRVHLSGRIDFLSLEVGDYDGRLINTQAAVSYRLFRNIDVGAMYRYVDYELGVEKPAWVGDAAYTFKGPALFVQAAF